MGTFSTARMMRAVVIWCLLWAAGFTDAEKYMKYKDPKRPLNERINDLVGRMTTEEKIGQMTQIERLIGSRIIVNKYFIETQSLRKKIGEATALELRATGIPFAFAQGLSFAGIRDGAAVMKAIVKIIRLLVQ